MCRNHDSDFADLRLLMIVVNPNLYFSCYFLLTVECLQYTFWIHSSNLSPSHIRSHTMRSLGCQHTDVVFNIKNTIADGISNGNANGPFRTDFYISGIPSMYNFSGSKYDFSFQLWKKKYKKGRRWKRVLIFHIQAKYVFERRFTAKHLTMFGFFLTYSQSVRAREFFFLKKGEKGQKWNFFWR